MNIHRKTQNHKTALICAAILLLLGVTYVAAAFFFKLPPFSAPTPPSVSDMIKEGIAPVTGDHKADTATEGLPENSSSTTSDEVPLSNETVSISEFSQSDGSVRATASVSANEGTCVFLYTTEGDKPVTQQVSVKDSSCHSSIAEVNFSKLGDWLLKVTYYRNAEKVEAMQNVEIR